MSDDLKVTDRRWWARNDQQQPVDAEEPKLKPTYVEELEKQVATKDQELQRLLSKFRAATEEFEGARARLRKELSKDVERGRRSMLISFLEVLDNLDRALDAAVDRVDDPFVQGVSLVRQQFLSTLEGFGVTRVEPLGQPFDPALHDAVSRVAATPDAPPGTVCGIVRPGYLIADEVLRPAQVAVSS